MPDQPKSTSPPIPPVTPREAEAQRTLVRILKLVALLRWFLEEIHFRLTDPPDAEAMGIGEVPESLTFSLRGTLECALSDHVKPLQKILREAVRETPESLIRDWQKRQGKGKVH